MSSGWLRAGDRPDGTPDGVDPHSRGCGTRCVDRAGINEPAANCGRHIQTDRRASADGSARPGLSTRSNAACCAKLRCKSDVMMPNRLAPALSRYRLEPREGASVSSKFKRRSPRLATCSSPQRAADLGRIHANWHEIGWSSSLDRNGDRHIDIATDRIRVRADGMSALDEPFGGLLVDASNGHGKRCGQHEAACFISTEVDRGDDVDIVIGKAVARVPAHMQECILKAG